MYTFDLDLRLPAWPQFLSDLENQQVIKRLWSKDSTLFKGKDHMLGWLSAPERELKSLEKLKSLKDAVLRHNFSAIVLLGMGGSSLAARVFHQCLSTEKNFLVVDTIHPDELYRLEHSIDITKTLFIVASKSGFTLETDLLYHHFLKRLIDKKVSDPFCHFMAISDPISPLEQIAQENGFLQGTFGDPDIGGRFSALTAFGLMPAVLMDIDVEALLKSSITMAEQSGPDVLFYKNPSAMLGAFLGFNAINGHTTLYGYFSPTLKPLAAWLEQLIAESLGKDQKGIIPVFTDNHQQKIDAMHCFIELEGEEGFSEQKKFLKDKDCSVSYLTIPDLFSIASLMYQWEIAISIAGSIMQVNPFDQPDVEKSKKAAKKTMESFFLGKESVSDNKAIFDSFVQSLKNSSYAVLLSYLDENKTTQDLLLNLAHEINEHYNIPTLIQSGPRYLHSTGQLFKGGPNTGAFLMITGPYSHDYESNIKGLSLRDIHLCQALGDYDSMAYDQRTIRRINLLDIRDLKELTKKLLDK